LGAPARLPIKVALEKGVITDAPPQQPGAKKAAHNGTKKTPRIVEKVFKGPRIESKERAAEKPLAGEGGVKQEWWKGGDSDGK